MIEKDTLNRAAELANGMEKLFEGEELASVMYAIGMVVAHIGAMSDRVDGLDGTLHWIDRISRNEMSRQFRRH